MPPGVSRWACATRRCGSTERRYIGVLPGGLLRLWARSRVRVGQHHVDRHRPVDRDGPTLDADDLARERREEIERVLTDRDGEHIQPGLVGVRPGQEALRIGYVHAR